MKKILFVICFCMAASLSFAQKKVIIKAGTIVPLQAVEKVKAADVNEGELVDFRVITDIIADGCIAVPKGTLVKGIVNEAKKSSIAGTKGRLTINIRNAILPSGDYLFFSNTTAKIYGKNRTPLAVVTSLFLWPCIFIPGTRAEMPEGYEIHAIVAANTEVSI
ncbi:MAG: hypothetical protein IJN24_01215 [Bacteroidaceae bacterium]|nr:hypothetical protein [Bacteroidaceae bacterium]